ncbi:uncharacterized protein EAE97_008606 [Botrytis byssoidea]|uniref:Uncharacterized protein n=1 Tax=Botrytis byssoidea TaxID=139641 RepID=A0A9P5IEC9_9HELO|nr:uncharacterized protein EAE97_008606 [Botrytis byssoidea]KAF7934246.1 hypothetical protein EAE97_008606 [Botrytis byssoidea]
MTLRGSVKRNTKPLTDSRGSSMALEAEFLVIQVRHSNGFIDFQYKASHWNELDICVAPHGIVVMCLGVPGGDAQLQPYGRAAEFVSLVYITLSALLLVLNQTLLLEVFFKRYMIPEICDQQIVPLACCYLNIVFIIACFKSPPILVLGIAVTMHPGLAIPSFFVWLTYSWYS